MTRNAVLITLAAFAAAAIALTLWLAPDDRKAAQVDPDNERQEAGPNSASPNEQVVEKTTPKLGPEASDEESPRVAVKTAERRGPDSKMESIAFGHARRLAPDELDVPRNLEMTEDEWKEAVDLHMTNEGRVMKWQSSMHNIGLRIVDDRDTRGAYEEVLVGPKGILPTPTTQDGQVVMRRWKRNDKKEKVVRIFRINPGTSQQFDLHKKSHDSANEVWRLEAEQFLRKVLARTSSK